MLITTQARSGASSHITDLDEAHSELKQAHNQHKSTSQMATDHQAFDKTEDAQTLDETLKDQNEQVKSKEPAKPNEGQFPELTAPHLVIHSVAGTELTTPKSTHLHSGEHLALTAGQHLSLSVGKRLLASAMQGIRLFAQSTGIKMFAAKGKVEIQAQSNNLEIIADQVLKIISAKKTIEIAAAEEILLTAKGSYIKINGAGIEHGTPAKWIVYSATKTLTGPKELPYALPTMPHSFSEYFIVRNQDTNKPMAFYPYQIKRQSGELVQGETDEKGHTKEIAGMQSEKITFMAEEAQCEEVQAYLGGEESPTLLKLEMRSKIKNAQ